MREQKPVITQAQKMMIEDGFPASLIFTPKQREEAWAGRSLTTMMSNFAMPKVLTAEAIAFTESQAERKQMKDKARIAKMLQRKSSPDPKTHHWDTAKSRWVLNRIYRREDNMRPDFYTLDNSELVKVFNEMAVEAANLQHPVSLVKRFTDRDTAIRRCEELYKAICEKKNLDYEKPQRPPEEAGKPPTVKVSKSKAAKPAKKVETAAKAPKQPKVKKEGLAISEACGVRGGTKQEVILLYLEERLGKQVPQTAILKHLYGDPNAKTLRFLALTRTMKKAKGYILKQEKDDKGNISYGLYKKSGNS